MSDKKIPNKGTWLFIECPIGTTEEMLQAQLYERCGIDLSLDRISMRSAANSSIWNRALVSLLPCHFDQILNFCFDNLNKDFPMFALPYPKPWKKTDDSGRIVDVKEEATT